MCSPCRVGVVRSVGDCEIHDHERPVRGITLKLGEHAAKPVNLRLDQAGEPVIVRHALVVVQPRVGHAVTERRERVVPGIPKGLGDGVHAVAQDLRVGVDPVVGHVAAGEQRGVGWPADADLAAVIQKDDPAVSEFGDRWREGDLRVVRCQKVFVDRARRVQQHESRRRGRGRGFGCLAARGQDHGNTQDGGESRGRREHGCRLYRGRGARGRLEAAQARLRQGARSAAADEFAAAYHSECRPLSPEG